MHHAELGKTMIQVRERNTTNIKVMQSNKQKELILFSHYELTKLVVGLETLVSHTHTHTHTYIYIYISIQNPEEI